MGRYLLAFVLFWCLPGSSQVSPPAGVNVVQYTVTVDQPAYAGEPIWIHTEPALRVHYPFRTGIGDFGCNRLELMRAGKLIAAQKLQILGDRSGALCGWLAVGSAPAGRLPLHIWFPSLRPGKYAVRWISQSPDFSSGKLHFSNGTLQMLEVASEWTTFEVRRASPGQRGAWLRDLLAHVPSDPGTLAGDYIPNLVAAAPDDRALRALGEQLYSENRAVAELAASALEVFPQARVNALLPQLFHTEGPSAVLATLVCTDALRQHRAEFVADSIRFLTSPRPGRIAAAIETLGFLAHNPADRKMDRADQAAADTAVLNAAPDVIASGDSEATRQLALYLGHLEGAEAHDFLWQIASSGSPSAEQARIALTWNPMPDDLPRLAALLLRPGDPDPTGRDLSSLPQSFMHGYGESAVPWLQKAVHDSPYVWVRTQSAEELARRDDPAAFRFFLDAIEGNRFYSAEMIRFLKDTFPSDLGPTADSAAVVAFLKHQLAANEGQTQ